MEKIDRHIEQDVDFLVTDNFEGIDFDGSDAPYGAIIHECGDNNNLYIGDCRVTDNFNVGDKDDTLKTIKVGGLDASTIGELRISL